MAKSIKSIRSIQNLKTLQLRIKELEGKLTVVKDFKVIPEKTRSDKAFKEALVKLSSDPAYRRKALTNPQMITDDFKLSIMQLKSLREVAVMSGANVTKVNNLQAAVIGGLIKRPGGLTSSVDVSCCSCCCCCCGETSVQTAYA